MILAIAALLIQPHFVPQLSLSSEKLILVQPVVSALTSEAPVNVDSLPPTPAEAENNVTTVAAADSSALPDAPVLVPVVNASAPAAFIKPGKSMTVSVGQLLEENRRKQILWKGLAIASGSAATFDAWTTRRAITTLDANELNPLLKPFAGNSSLYAAIQVGPALMDYAGKKMMNSRHTWVRRMWWVPQSASFVSSIFCGAHNLTVQ